MLDSLAPLPPQRSDRGARLAPRLEDFSAPAGPICLPATAEHRLRVHTGAPARGVCGRHAFVYTRGVLDLLPAGSSEEWCSDEPTDMLLITLPSVLVQRAAAELGRSEPGLDARCLFRDPRIEHIAWALDAERSSGGGALYAESLGLALAYHLLSAYASSTDGPTRDRRVFSPSERRRIIEHVEAHLDQNLSLGALADTLGMSSSHFKVLFRRSLGLPVHEYVIQRRVERAKALLLEGELPPAEVAFAAGFAHQSHMARCMRRVLGITPSALRRAAGA